MYPISNERARRARLAIVLAAGFFFLPVTAGHVGQVGYASAWAGDQGGGHDKVPEAQIHTGYSASAPLPEPRSDSCMNGAMGSVNVPPVQHPYTNDRPPERG